MPGFHLFFIFHVVVWDDIVVCIGPCVSGTGRVGAWRGSAGGDAPGRRALQQLPRPWAAARMPSRHRSPVVRRQHGPITAISAGSCCVADARGVVAAGACVVGSGVWRCCTCGSWRRGCSRRRSIRAFSCSHADTTGTGPGLGSPLVCTHTFESF